MNEFLKFLGFDLCFGKDSLFFGDLFEDEEEEEDSYDDWDEEFDFDEWEEEDS